MATVLKKPLQKMRNNLLFLRQNIFSGITYRWLTNIFGSIFFATVILIILFCMFAKDSYYNMVKDRLRTDAQNVGHYYATYISASSFETAAHQLIDDFGNKDLMEIQISNLSGTTAVSSSGFSMSDAQTTPDLLSARSDRADGWVGKLAASGEKVYSYSAPLYDSSGNIKGTVRLITALSLTNRHLIQLYLFAIAIGAFIVLMTIVSGVYFIKSIVVPVNQITETAHAIAKGNMADRIEKFNRNDEIGALCTTINAMAEELSETERVKNDFISSISHELRTPLTSIRGWSETMIAAGGEMDDTTRRGIGIIYKETERLSRLVEELLDTTRMQNNRFKLVVSPMNIVAEFEDTVFMMMERAKIDDVSIEYTPTLDEVTMLGDKNRLKQVFFNIIDNAIKHSHPNGKIQTSLSTTDENVVIVVADHGEGISREDLPFVKEMFYKGHSQKRGSGIGLGVSDQIVTLHGGTLDIQSQPDVGTTVTITLPLNQAEEQS